MLAGNNVVIAALSSLIRSGFISRNQVEKLSVSEKLWNTFSYQPNFWKLHIACKRKPQIFFGGVSLFRSYSTKHSPEIIDFESQNIRSCSWFICRVAIGSHSRDSSSANEKAYLIRGPSRPSHGDGDDNDDQRSRDREYDMQNGDHETTLVQGSRTKTEFSVRSRMSTDETSMDDESIENRCAPSGDGHVGVPSAIPVSADDGLFGGERRAKTRTRRLWLIPVRECL